MIELTLPQDNSKLKDLKAGDYVRLSGVIYTLRDAGHRRLVASYQTGAPDFDVAGAAIYYCGPTPTLKGEIIGSCGPTTSARMDSFTPFLVAQGLAVMIGKGKRSDAVIAAMKQYGAVYLLSVGGAGALYKKTVIHNEPLLYDDLGCEAMRKLTVQNMDLIVGIDALGRTILQ